MVDGLHTTDEHLDCGALRSALNAAAILSQPSSSVLTASVRTDEHVQPWLGQAPHRVIGALICRCSCRTVTAPHPALLRAETQTQSIS